MKSCFKCGIEKPLTEFYRHSQMGDGYLNKCKECTKADAHRYRQENSDKVNAYDRKRYRQPERHAYAVKQCEDWAKNNPDRVSELKKKWQSRNPEKRAAHIAVGNAIKYGKIIKGTCEVCGGDKVHAHHDDYSKPLEVRWLCATHHAEVHYGKPEQITE